MQEKQATQALQKAWHTLSDDARQILRNKGLISRHTAEAINTGTDNIIAKNPIPTKVVDMTPDQFENVLRGAMTNPHSLVGQKQLEDSMTSFKNSGGAASYRIGYKDGSSRIYVHKLHSNPEKMQNSMFKTDPRLTPTTQESEDYLKAIVDRHEADEAKYSAINKLRGKNNRIMTHSDIRVLENESKNMTFAPEETRRILGTVRYNESKRAKAEGLNYIDIMNYGNKR